MIEPTVVNTSSELGDVSEETKKIKGNSLQAMQYEGPDKQSNQSQQKTKENLLDKFYYKTDD